MCSISGTNTTRHLCSLFSQLKVLGEHGTFDSFGAPLMPAAAEATSARAWCTAGTANGPCCAHSPAVQPLLPQSECRDGVSLPQHSTSPPAHPRALSPNQPTANGASRHRLHASQPRTALAAAPRADVTLQAVARAFVHVLCS